MDNTFPVPVLPEYANDIRLNLSSLFRSGGAPGLGEEQALGVALAAAIAARNPRFAAQVEEYVAANTDEATVNAAKAAAA